MGNKANVYIVYGQQLEEEKLKCLRHGGSWFRKPTKDILVICVVNEV